MLYLIAGVLILAYVVVAVLVARFCGVNRGWEEAVDDVTDDEIVDFGGGHHHKPLPTRRV